jgi:hypothetical protein
MIAAVVLSVLGCVRNQHADLGKGTAPAARTDSMRTERLGANRHDSLLFSRLRKLDEELDSLGRDSRRGPTKPPL